ncbi:MAG: hypothetical protein QM820_65655 [Minicystis sp.]
MRLLRLASSLLISVAACGPSPALDPQPAAPRAPRAVTSTPPPIASWVKRMGGAGKDACEGVHVDAAGNVFVVGLFTGTADFGQGPLTSAGKRDAFVVKIDPGGQPVFSKRLGGADHDAATAVATDAAGNAIVVGYATGMVDLGAGPVGRQTGLLTDVFVVALGPGGEPRWSKLLHSPGEHPRPAVAVDVAGNVIVTGHFEGEIELGGKHTRSAGRDDVFVIKLAPDGTFLWGRAVGGAGVDTGTAIAVDPAGHVIVAGESEGPIDFGQGPIGAGAGHQGFVVALDGANGATLWGRAVGAHGQGGASGITIDAGGHVTVVGVATEAGSSAPGRARTFVAQLDPAGRETWGDSLGDAGSTHGTAVAEDVAGNVIVTGTILGPVDPARPGGETSAFLGRFDPGGHRTGLARLGGGPGGWAEGRTVAFDRAGQMVIGGSFGGRLALAGGALQSAGDSDVFVARLPPHGVW